MTFEIKERSTYIVVPKWVADIVSVAAACERGRMFQAMHNNLWDNHPGEIDRWADDGGASSHAVPSATSEQRKPLENEGFTA